ncbi:hypothetical protein [Bradyrhizobium sp. WD16]|uniref:hypothetical protein n=1 Tax=Bradyrhizobium sp. WD16 TaxID=1521768 RepID=UPI0020A23632|nr:hypothetical protein [Bradyrhizobium sp. WD16]UTD29091.1 hypothetical protein DB459_21490 [Bradyrhizobium sp. WD16]
MSVPSRCLSGGPPQPCPAKAADRARPSPVGASLLAFARAGLRPQTPLQKTIVAALCAKIALIVSLQLLLSAAGARVATTDLSVVRLFGLDTH